ncbi:MAG: Gfo/Idh/MocA family oxidoreductase [Pseudomonadaceae bacterium]|nr:Gfo/Idh/MocA family oxidoreductase [Pseudomonadaceae bacterium]
MNQALFYQGRRVFNYLADEDRYLSGSRQPNLKFGFIGCGIMGQEHIRNTVLEGRAAIGGLYDLSQRSVEHAQKLVPAGQSKELQIYSDLQEACNDPRTDALIVATPNHTHLEVMRIAATSGKAVFLEKPIATTLTDALEISNLTEQYQLNLHIGLQYRFKSIYSEAIREVLTLNAIGEVQQVNLAEHRFPFLDKVGQWNKFNRYSGGTLIEKCCHYFDLMNLFAGARPDHVFATGRQAVNFKAFNYANEQADALDQANVVVEYSNGVSGSFSLCMFVPGTSEELVVCGNRGRLSVSEKAQLGEPNVNHLELWSGEHGVSKTSSPAYPGYIEKAGHHGSTFFEHVNFVDSILGQPNAGPTLDDALWSVAVAAAAQQSINTHTPVSVKALFG